MSRNRSQRGEGRLGCLFGIVVLIAAGLAAYRLIPVKVKTADLRETVVSEGRSAGSHNDGRIHQNILRHATELELPVTAEQIKVRRANSYIYIDVDYTVPIEFPGFTYQWKFHHHAENPIF
ncbi:MAG: hypothetical protein ABI779_01890 [Acidobacteriota bacterium]